MFSRCLRILPLSIAEFLITGIFILKPIFSSTCSFFQASEVFLFIGFLFEPKISLPNCRCHRMPPEVFRLPMRISPLLASPFWCQSPSPISRFLQMPLRFFFLFIGNFYFKPKFSLPIFRSLQIFLRPLIGLSILKPISSSICRCLLSNASEFFRFSMRNSSSSAFVFLSQKLSLSICRCLICLPRFSACQCGSPRFWHLQFDANLHFQSLNFSECLPKFSACQCGCLRFWQFLFLPNFLQNCQIYSNLLPEVFRLMSRISSLLPTPFWSLFPPSIRLFLQYWKIFNEKIFKNIIIFF